MHFNELVDDVSDLEKICINFNEIFISRTNHNYDIIDNGLTISNLNLSNEKFSDGQKTIFVLEQIIKPIFDQQNLTIIFDDFFEKMDFLNLKESYKILTKFTSANILILTHNDVQYDLYKNIDLSQNKHLVFKSLLLTTIKEGEFKFNLLYSEHACLTFNTLVKMIDSRIKNNFASVEHLIVFCKFLNRHSLLESSINLINDNDKNNINICKKNL